MRDKGLRASGAASPGSRVSDLPSVLTCTTSKTLSHLLLPAQPLHRLLTNMPQLHDVSSDAWPGYAKAVQLRRPFLLSTTQSHQQAVQYSSQQRPAAAVILQQQVCCGTQHQNLEMLTSSGLRGCSSAPGEERAACSTRRLESTARRPFAVFAKSREVVKSVGPTPAVTRRSLKQAVTWAGCRCLA